MSATIHEPEVLEVAPQLDRLEAQTRGEIDIQIATAKRYPRSIKVFRDQALEAATLDEETAASCFYAMPRSGKTVEGPSARLAEIVASCWGHLRIDARSMGDDGRFTTSKAIAWDVQNNVAVGFEVKRRVTGKDGKTFNDDMIVVTSNAASSIALRNAVFKVVPSPFWRPIYMACRKVAVGDAKTLTNRRAAAIETFGKMGVTPAMIFGLLGVKGEIEITLEHLATLLGVFTAIKDGETTVDQAFASIPSEPQRVVSSEPVTTEQVAANTEPQPQTKTGAPPVATTAKDYEVRGQFVYSTDAVEPGSWEIVTVDSENGEQTTFATKVEALYKEAATLAGNTEHRVVCRFRKGKRQDGRAVAVLTGLALDEAQS